MKSFAFIIQSAITVMSFRAGKFLNELISVQLNPPIIPKTILSYENPTSPYYYSSSPNA